MKHFFTILRTTFIVATFWQLQNFICPGQQSLNVQLLSNWDDSSVVASGNYSIRYNEIWGFTMKGREYAVIGSTFGTHIVDVTDHQNPVRAAYIPVADSVTLVTNMDFKTYQNFLYIVCDQGNNTLQIADVSLLPDSVKIVYDSDSMISQAHTLFVDTVNAILYASSVKPGYLDLALYSLANPAIPSFITGYDAPEMAHQVFVRNDTAYINDGYSGLFIVDFSNTSSPQMLGGLTSYPDQGYNHSGWLSEDGRIYVFADETHGMDLKICDVTDPTDIQILSQVNSNVSSKSIAHNPVIKNGYLFISYYYDGLQIFNINNTAGPVLAGYYDTYPDSNELSFRGAWGVYPFLPSGAVLVSDMQTGLYIFDVSQALSEGTEKYEIDDIFISPNPVHGKIDMAFSSTLNGPVKISLTNLLGTSVFYDITSDKWHGLSHYSISTAGMNDGIYFLEVEATGMRTLQKIVVE